jgi:hypothetical protein
VTSAEQRETDQRHFYEHISQGRGSGSAFLLDAGSGSGQDPHVNEKLDPDPHVNEKLDLHPH